MDERSEIQRRVLPQPPVRLIAAAAAVIVLAVALTHSVWSGSATVDEEGPASAAGPHSVVNEDEPTFVDGLPGGAGRALADVAPAIGAGDVSPANGNSVKQLQGGLIHRPSDTPEPVVVRRKEAWALAESAPELADVSIIPTLISYIQDSDAEVIWAGETSLSRIAMSEEADESGLRTAVRDNGVLTATLFANVGYESLDWYDEDVRVLAVDVITNLYLEMPSPMIEQAMVDRWEVESSMRVLQNIVRLLCEHGYDSQDTVDILTYASQDDDPILSQLGVECLARIQP